MIRLCSRLLLAANFAGILMAKNLPTEHCYRITYILLVILGLVLLWQGGSYLMFLSHG